MAKVKKNKPAPPQVYVDEKGIHYISDPEEGAKYVTLTEYIRLRHEADLKKDALADPLYDSSIRKVLKRGEIVVLRQGIHSFIDWNKYKNFVFMRYKQMPVKRKK